MKVRIVMCTLVLMFSAFAGSVFGGTELGAPSYNTFLGLSAGIGNTGKQNAIMGYGAGALSGTTDQNVFIGYGSGSSASSPQGGNTFVGAGTGVSSTGYGNSFLGGAAGYTNTTGYGNVFLGAYAGYLNNVGYGNAFVGTEAGYKNTTGYGNVLLGTYAGYNNTTGYGNVFLGSFSGYNETGSNKLYIDNTGTGIATPLIYGEFDNKILAVNGSLGIGTQTPARMLHLSGAAVFRMDRTSDTAAFQMVRTDVGGNPQKVFVVGTNYSPSTGLGEFVINDNGTALSGPGTRRMTMANDGTVTFTGNVFATAFNPSSLTLKDNVRTYENALDTVNRLRGVSFDWKDSGKPAVGLIAEEVAKVVPEVVAYNDGAAAGVNYASLVGVLVEAVKEQQAQHQAEMKEQQQINAELRAELNELKGLLTSK